MTEDRGYFGPEYNYHRAQTGYENAIPKYTEHVEVAIATPVYMVQIEIGSPRGMGHVVNVKAKNPATGQWSSLYSGNVDREVFASYSATGQYWKWAPDACRTQYKASEFRIEVDTSIETGIESWNYIDYVKVYGSETLQSAALHPGATHLVYIPTEHENGVDTIEYHASDCPGDLFRNSKDAGILSINIASVNDPPEVYDAYATMVVGATKRLPLSFYDVEDGKNLTIMITALHSSSYFEVYDISGAARTLITMTPYTIDITKGTDEADGAIVEVVSLSMEMNVTLLEYKAADSDGAMSATTAKLRVASLMDSCPPGYTQVLGDQHNLEGTVVPKCEACPAGKFEQQNLICANVSSYHYIPYPASVIDDQIPCKNNSQVLRFVVDGAEVLLQSATGASNETECLCKPTFYLGVDGVCAPCPGGAICAGANFPPVAAEGYGMYSELTNNFFECPLYDVCIGADKSCDCMGGKINMVTQQAVKYQCDESKGYKSGSFLCGECMDGSDFPEVCEDRYHAKWFIDAVNIFITGVNSTYNGTYQVCENNGTKYAKRQQECEACEWDDHWYVIITIVLVFLWFPLLRDLITKRMTSLYTSLAFIQYLGIYSQFRIAWRTGIGDAFQALELFNLSFDTLHLACAMSWETMWLLQALLPLLYIFVTMIEIGVKAVVVKDYSVMSGIRTGFGTGLFFINMYYFTGISNSFDMLMCEDDGEGKSYLLMNPPTECWTGSHPSYATVAVLEMIMYMILLPGFYVYILLVHIPATGLGHELNLKTYGFLYERFLPDKHWWELLETMRKFVFAVVAKLGANMATIDAAFIALVSVTIVMLSEVKMSPFKSALYDIVEEFTTCTEFSVLMLGIMALYRSTSDVGLEWIEAIAWVFLSVSFLLVLLAACVDVKNGLNLNWVYKLRNKGVLLSPAIFDLQFCKYLLPNFVAQADESDLRVMKNLEDILVRLIDEGKILHADDSASLDEYASIAKVAPMVADYMASGGKLALRESKAQGDTAAAFAGAVEQAKNYAGSAAPGGKIKVPGCYMFNTSLLGTVLAFMDRKASAEELQAFKTFINVVQTYELKVRDQKLGLVAAGLIHMDLMGLRKHVQAKNKQLFEHIVPPVDEGKSYFKVNLNSYTLNFSAVTTSEKVARRESMRRFSLFRGATKNVANSSTAASEKGGQSSV